MAALRCAVVALCVCLLGGCDLAIVDIVSLPVVVFRLFRVPVLFYCHFPDKTLEQTMRKTPSSALRRWYRCAIDSIEQFALKQASVVVCNSEFTKNVYRQTYPSLPVPDVVYPCVQPESDLVGAGELRTSEPVVDASPYVVSLNRYERKKNIPLAIHAFKRALQELETVDSSCNLRLVLAGGFDTRLKENVEHYAELEHLVIANGLQGRVELRQNIPDAERRALLSGALVLLYTPSNEHFGIVPLEAMVLGTAVLAADSGGPTESVADGKTGFLRAPTPDDFAEVIVQLARNPGLGREMGRLGHERVAAKFSLQALAGSLEPILRACVTNLRQ
jgi:alpha-1,3/alpha-1,6-mannosyltransferase